MEPCYSPDGDQLCPAYTAMPVAGAQFHIDRLMNGVDPVTPRDGPSFQKYPGDPTVKPTTRT
jgi:hypothetical protein